jgi:mannose-6-phosphate isomerase-like protein (cupin superfamily)/GNAT superfamily N-acetyltransferase
MSPIETANLVIRPCRPDEEPLMSAIVCDAATAYKGVIPPDRYHEPYMPLCELRAEIAAGVQFWGAEVPGESGGELVGIMGIQDIDNAVSPEQGGIGDVTLIRHAYVRTNQRGLGIGGRLLRHLMGLASRPLLMGTWAAATWAVSFYQKHGFTLTARAEKEKLLRVYWNIPERQVETSVVLADARAMALVRGSERGKVSAEAEFAQIKDFWSPRLVAELNGQQVKFCRLKGEFDWHAHAAEDEMFWVLEGELTIRLREGGVVRDVVIGPNEFYVVPRGVEHKPVCAQECRVMLFEPAATKQYGDQPGA